MDEQTGLDLVLVFPGAGSLGTYQAGAAACVMAGRHHLARAGADVRIPAVGGASAGATVALLSAHALAHGLDPVGLLRAAWVERVDLDLLASGSAAPLGHQGLRRELRALLERDSFDLQPSEPLEPSDVAIHIALTSLRGYRYQLSELGRRPVDAVTYADWATVRYPAGADPTRLTEAAGSSPLELVIASIANPVVFPPLPVMRSGSTAEFPLRDEAASRGSNLWWFTDGGLVQSRPIHRTLELVPPADRRLRCVVIDPRSEGPSSGDTWVGPRGNAGWRRGLMRALAISPAQVLSDELRRLDDDNRILESLETLAESLEVADPEGFERWADARGLSMGENGVLDALVAAAGLAAARRVEADVIHPLLVAEQRDVAGLLAGELLGDFGGFLAEELRASDFALGYECGREWWRATLDEQRFEMHRDALDEHLAHQGPPPWTQVDRGRAALRDLPVRAKLRLAKVALRAVRALLRA